MAWIRRYPNRNMIIPTVTMIGVLKGTEETMAEQTKNEDLATLLRRERVMSLRPSRRRKMEAETAFKYHVIHPEEMNERQEILNPRPAWINPDGTRNKKYTMVQLRTLQMMGANYHRAGDYLLTPSLVQEVQTHSFVSWHVESRARAH